jgi:hypothetical protein
MIRNAAAMVAGIILAFGAMVLIEETTSLVYPPPPNLDFSDTDSARPYLATLPAGEFLLVFASSVVAAFIGTLVACYIGTSQRRLFGAVVGGVVLARTIANFITYPYPHWLSIATIFGVVGFTLLAMRISPPSMDPEVSESDTG